MPNSVRRTNAEHTLLALLSANKGANTPLDRADDISNQAFYALGSTFSAPLFIYKMQQHSLLCLLINGELQSLFTDNSNRVELKHILSISFEKMMPTAGSFFPAYNDMFLLCFIPHSSLDLVQPLIGLTSRICLYHQHQEISALTIREVAIKGCTTIGTYAVIIGYRGELFFLRIMNGSLSIAASFPTSSSFATELVLSNERLFGARSFHITCRVLMLNTSATPLLCSSSSHFFFLYPNGVFLAFRELTLEIYALLQPVQSGSSEVSSSIIKVTAFSVSTTHVFVGFANGVLNVYDLAQIVRDMHSEDIFARPLISMSVINAIPNSSYSKLFLNQTEDKVLHKVISALHPVYVKNNATHPPPLATSQDNDSENNISVYLTEPSNEPVASGLDQFSDLSDHSDLGILIAINGLDSIFLFTLFPKPYFRDEFMHEGHSQLKLLTTNITQILFLASNCYTQTLYVKLLNGSLFKLRLPENIMLRTVLEAVPSNNFTRNTASARAMRSYLSHEFSKRNTVLSIPYKSQFSRHPFITSTENLSKSAHDSIILVNRLFPYGRYSSRFGRSTSPVSTHNANDLKFNLVGTNRMLDSLLENNIKSPYSVLDSHTGQFVRSTSYSQGRTGLYFRNLLTRGSSLALQVLQSKKSMLKHNKDHANYILSVAIPNEKIYHQVTLLPDIPARSRYVLSVLPTGNSLGRSLDDMALKPKPVLTQFRALSGTPDPILSTTHDTKTKNLVEGPFNKHVVHSNITHRRHLLKIDFPIPDPSYQISNAHKYTKSSHFFSTVKNLVSTSLVDTLPSSNENSTPHGPISNSHWDINMANNLTFSRSEPINGEERVTCTDGSRIFDLLGLSSSYKAPSSSRQNNDLRCKYPHKKMQQDSGDVLTSLLDFNAQAVLVEREGAKRRRARYFWPAHREKVISNRVDGDRVVDESQLCRDAVTVTPAKLHTFIRESSKKWLAKKGTSWQRTKYLIDSFSSSRHERQNSHNTLEFFYININDLFNNPVAMEILNLQRIDTNKQDKKQISTSLLSDGKISIHPSIASTDMHLDQYQGYSNTDCNNQLTTNPDRQLVTSHSDNQDFLKYGESQIIIQTALSHEQQIYPGIVALDENPLLSPIMASNELASETSQEIVSLNTTLPDFSLRDHSPIIEPSKQDNISPILERMNTDASKSPLQPQNHHAMFDDMGNLVVFSDPCISDMIATGDIPPITNLFANKPVQIIDSEPVRERSESACKLFKFGGLPLVGMNLNQFSYKRLRISHNKYDLFCLCTYRGPIPVIDDDTKRFLQVTEQRSKYHLNTLDPRAVPSNVNHHSPNNTIDNLTQWRQVVMVMTEQLNRIAVQKEKIQQVYRELIRCVLNNVHRLHEANCIMKIILGNETYYSTRQVSLEQSSSSSDRLNQSSVELKDSEEKLKDGACKAEADMSSISSALDRFSQEIIDNNKKFVQDGGLSMSILSMDSADEFDTNILTNKNQTNNSCLESSAHIDELSVSNIDICDRPVHVVLSQTSSDSESIPDIPRKKKEGSLSDYQLKDHELGAFPTNYIIHRDKTKILFDIYAEDQEYSDDDPIFTEDNPKYVATAFTSQQLRGLFNMTSHNIKALLQGDAEELLSLDAELTPQLWFMKTAYYFSMFEVECDQTRSPTLRNALSFQQLRTQLTLGDIAEHSLYDEAVLILDAALPDGEDSRDACIPEETSADLNPGIYEDDIASLAYEDMSSDQRLTYLLNESYVDATNLYLGKTIDDLSYFIKEKKHIKSRMSSFGRENVTELMTALLDLSGPRILNNYTLREGQKTCIVSGKGNSLLTFIPKLRANGALVLCVPQDNNQVYTPPASQVDQSTIACKKSASVVPATNTSHFVLGRKGSYFGHNPLIDMLQKYYLIRDYFVLYVYYNRIFTLPNRKYTRSSSASSWLGKQRKKQTILDLWNETYATVPKKLLWDSALAIKRTSPVRQMVARSNCQDFSIKSLVLDNISHIKPILDSRLSYSPQIGVFVSLIRNSGIEYKQAIAELSKAELYSPETSALFAELYKVERLETEKHLKDLYEVAHRTGNAKLYGLCINVMLFAPYLKTNVFVDASNLITEDLSTDSSTLDPSLSLGPSDEKSNNITAYVQNSVAPLLIDFKTKCTKADKEKKRMELFEKNVRALMFKLEDNDEMDVSNVAIPFDMRFDYKDLRPGRCYYCAGTFVEIPLLPPYRFEKDCNIENEIESFVKKQVKLHITSARSKYQSNSDELDKLKEKAEQVIDENMVLFDMRFMYIMYPVLYTNFAELLLCRRMKRMNVNSDVTDITALLKNVKIEGSSLQLETDDNLTANDENWKSMMAESLCILEDVEIEEYEKCKTRIATEVMAEVNTLDTYLTPSMATRYQQTESPLKVLQATPTRGIIKESTPIVPVSPCLQDSGINIAELSPDNRVVPTKYKNIIDMQINHIFETNYKYYEYITAQAIINDKSFRLGLMPIKSMIRDVLFECLATLPPLARFIAKKLIENGKIFKIEELQMLPFVLLQAQLLSKSAKDLVKYLRHKLAKIHANEIRRSHNNAEDTEFLMFIPRHKTIRIHLDAEDSSNITDNACKPKIAWREYMYRPCSQLLDFDDNWGDHKEAINANKRLFDYCSTLLYHTKLSMGRIRQLMLWKLRQISKRDKGAFKKGDSFKDVASKYNNIATSMVARTSLMEAGQFSKNYEMVLNKFSEIVALGQRASPSIMYLIKIKQHFICLYEDFSLKNLLTDERITGLKLDALAEMRREAQLHIYAVLRICGYKYVEDTMLSIYPDSLLLLYPLSLPINTNTLCTLFFNSPEHLRWIRNCSVFGLFNQSEDTTLLASTDTPNFSFHPTEENRYRLMLSMIMMIVKHHISRLRSGYSFFPQVITTLYNNITQRQVSFCLYNLVLFEMKLRINNVYITDWPRLSKILGSFNAEMFAEWLEVTFCNVYLTNRDIGKRDVVNYLQKQRTMISTIVSFAAHDTTSTHLNVNSTNPMEESTAQTDSGNKSLILNEINAGKKADTRKSPEASKQLIEGARHLTSPIRYQIGRVTVSELMLIDRKQFAADDAYEQLLQKSTFLHKVQGRNVDAMRADLDFRMTEFNIGSTNQEQDYHLSDHSGMDKDNIKEQSTDNFQDCDLSEKLTERIRIINRNLSPMSFRMRGSMDLSASMHELRNHSAEIQLLKKQHELNDTLRLSSTDTPYTNNSLSSMIQSADHSTEKSIRRSIDDYLQESSTGLQRRKKESILGTSMEREAIEQRIAGTKIPAIKHNYYTIDNLRIHGPGYTLNSQVPLPSKVQGAVRRILTPQPGKMGKVINTKQGPFTAYPRRPYSILGNISSPLEANLKKVPPPPESTFLSSNTLLD